MASRLWFRGFCFSGPNFSIASVSVKCEMDFVFDPSLSFSLASFIYPLRSAWRASAMLADPVPIPKPFSPLGLKQQLPSFDRVLGTTSGRVLFFLMTKR